MEGEAVGFVVWVDEGADSMFGLLLGSNTGYADITLGTYVVDILDCKVGLFDPVNTLMGDGISDGFT